MDSDRDFRESELADLATSRYELAKEAIQAGNQKEALERLDEIRQESVMIHDILRDWVTDTFSIIGERFGNEAVNELMTRTMENLLAPLNELFQAGFRECVSATAAIWRAHFSDFNLIEDDEKVTFVLKPCGSGGRQIEDGKYNGSEGFLRIAEAQPLTGGHTDCPVYCTHCFCMTRTMLAEKMPFVYTVEARDHQDTPECVFHIYKDPAFVPEPVCTVVGQGHQ
jgi:hypothetical protein